MDGGDGGTKLVHSRMRRAVALSLVSECFCIVEETLLRPPHQQMNSLKSLTLFNKITSLLVNY
jgi:hypothetical protein